jgi:hypothetical protein
MKIDMNYQRALHIVGLSLGYFVVAASPAFSEQNPSLSNATNWTKQLSLKQDNPFCFMQTSDNRVINLSQLCGSSTALTPFDQRFLSRYQSRLNQRIAKLPASVKVKLPKSQEALVARAKQACAEIAAGRHPNFPTLTPGTIDADIVNKLALQHYCPELND